jgi:hypothetical protein
VARWVGKRDAGELPVDGESVRRERMIDPFLAKLEEWVDPILDQLMVSIQLSDIHFD